MSAATAPSKEQLIERIKDLRWVHAIDLGGGVVTPGLWGGHSPSIWKAFDDIDFRGKKVLDIGCWDGLWSFEAEKRGAAEVYATDYSSQRYTDLSTFRLAHQILDSRAKYYPMTSVYDVDQLGVDDFDIVIYAGVYYHLKDPLRSFASLRRVMKDGGTILVEGAVLADEGNAEPAPPRRGLARRIARRLARGFRPAPPAQAKPAEPAGCYAKFFYRDTYVNDYSNWWVPTPSCLRQWVECSYFEIEKELPRWDAGKNPRATLIARAVRRKDPLYIYPDPDLADYYVA